MSHLQQKGRDSEPQAGKHASVKEGSSLRQWLEERLSPGSEALAPQDQQGPRYCLSEM